MINIQNEPDLGLNKYKNPFLSILHIRGPNTHKTHTHVALNAHTHTQMHKSTHILHTHCTISFPHSIPSYHEYKF